MFQHFNKNKDSYLSVLAAFVLSGLLGCASTGSPGGGLYDETPPVLKKAEPTVGATGVKDRKITLRFDENIKLDNAMEKLTVSPPQVKQPTIRSNAKTVVIELQDTLIPNSTYAIDLGDAVQDNNEGNPLEGLQITFSTGDHIDSMQVSGYVVNASNLEPVTGAYVGIYSEELCTDSVQIPGDSLGLGAPMGDSVLMKLPMPRAGRTDAYGKFTILGIAPGRYRMFALIDGNTNYKYDLSTEDIAFLDSLVVPSMKDHQVQDTLWADVDSTEVDTILTRGEILYLPNNIILRSFNEGKVTRYLDDYTRPDSCHLNIRFAAKMPELPTFSVVDSLEPEIDLLVEPNPTKDTLIYWIRDSLHIAKDTLFLQMSYLFTDTTGLDIIRTDTLRFTKPKVKNVSKKDEKKEQKKAASKGKKKAKGKKDKGKAVEYKALTPADSLNSDTLKLDSLLVDSLNAESVKVDSIQVDSVPKVQINYMTVKMLSGNSLDIGARPVIEVDKPLDSLRIEGIHLEQKVDSTMKEMKFTLQPDSNSIRRFIVIADPHFSPGASYQLTVDSAAMHDLYGNPVNTTKMEFKEKTTEEYSHLLFEIIGIDSLAFVELLNEKDAPVYQAKVIDGKAKFVNVKEGKYYARLTEDRNGNGKFDEGNLAERRQPEKVYYFNTELQLRANWDLLQTWDINKVEVMKQKPDSIKVNKPKEKTEKQSKNAEYLAKMGKTPPQTNSGTTTRTGTSSNMRTVERNR